MADARRPSSGCAKPRACTRASSASRSRPPRSCARRASARRSSPSSSPITPRHSRQPASSMPRSARSARRSPPSQGTGRTSLLLLRASFRQQLGDDASAVADLDRERTSSTSERVAESLVNGLERLRARAERDGDMPTERTATLRAREAARRSTASSSAAAHSWSRWIERDRARRRAAVHAVRPRRVDRALGRRQRRGDAARVRHRGRGPGQGRAARRRCRRPRPAGPATAVPVLELVHQQQPASRSSATSCARCTRRPASTACSRAS